MTYTHEMAEADGQRVWCEGCGMNPAECTCEDEKKYDCETCQDTGEVDTMEAVYPNEPHMAPIGTGRCPDCTGEDDADFSGATDGDR
jgi:hypothetical protein